MRNEKGVTLVEMLAALSILTIIGLVTWNVFFQGLFYSKKAESDISLQQEANIIAMKMTRIHQTSETYKVVSDRCEVKVTHTPITGDKTPQNTLFSNGNLCISSNERNKVTPATEEFDLNLSVYDSRKPDNKFELHTTLYRLRERD
ncbi:prepilin-type N-terminal cleavage/methylation domain-containing protein [Rossellomorea aquimaris]|uniref:type II secretion system protein n=1 Tax=Rossellomorea aquimaris TaxID=189382 RepID=UPI001CD4745E|nr:prepilin-type N-terminal cleavage/methylation domain-containing protein [Rossellomorea aquimaris]MCA1055243.1 prepilin-type N-terminal cleavage/methylation domain-containing protein [Rossellomorea aquimaris]